MEKIQKLTERLRREGVEKGQKEAERIVEDAYKKAADILAQAEKDATDIVAQAQKTAAETDAHIRDELRLYAEQAVQALKTEIADIITTKVSDNVAHELIESKNFLPELMLELAIEWAKNGRMVITTNDDKTLQSYFKAKAKELLNGGVEIKKISGRQTSCSIGPSDDSYKVSFGHAEFEAFFREQLRPSLVQYLFDSNK